MVEREREREREKEKNDFVFEYEITTTLHNIPTDFKKKTGNEPLL
jgi:hypothetical protein